jgi:hypothetical protein
LGSADLFCRSSFVAIRNYSKFKSRLLADAITENLPREIRDMVYALCWEDGLRQYNYRDEERPWRATDVIGEELFGNDEECSDDYFPPHPRQKALGPYPTKHFVQPPYVGAEAAREAATAFYRTAPAYIETLNTKRLGDFLDHDIFGLGLSPRDFITSIVFFLDPCVKQAYPLGGTFPTLQSTEEGLQAIAGPSSRKLPRMTFLVKEKTALETLELLDKSRPLHDQLKAAGATISVIYCYSYSRAFVVDWLVDLGSIMERPLHTWASHLDAKCKKQMPRQYASIRLQLRDLAGSSPYKRK